jgi:hypothetical protein
MIMNGMDHLQEMHPKSEEILATLAGPGLCLKFGRKCLVARYGPSYASFTSLTDGEDT